MKMSIEQKTAYKAYRRACRVSNIEPTLADFKAGDFPEYVRRDMEREQKPKALAASA
jgi:hypothetical protein